MTIDELVVKVSADITSLQAGLKAGSAEMLKLAQAQAKGIAASGDFARAAQVLGSALENSSAKALQQQQALNQLSGYTAKAADSQNRMAAATNNAKSASTTATATVGMFADTIQDASFGLQYAVNNLGPLIESFQRLTAHTGSTGQAFSALGSVLMGPAGLILFANLGLVLFNVGERMGWFGDSTKQLKVDLNSIGSAADAFKLNLSEIGNALDQLEEKAIQTRGALRTVAGASIEQKYFDARTTVQQQQALVDALQEKLRRTPQYEIIGTTQGPTRQASKEYLAIQQQLTRATRGLAESQNLLSAASERTFQSTTAAAAHMQRIIQAYKDGAGSIEATRRVFQEFGLTLDQATQKYNEYQRIDESIFSGKKPRSGGGTSGRTRSKEDRVSEIVSQIGLQIGAITQREMVDWIDSFNAASQKVEAIKSGISSLFNIGQTSTSPVVVRLLSELDEANAKLRAVREQIKITLSPLPTADIGFNKSIQDAALLAGQAAVNATMRTVAVPGYSAKTTTQLADIDNMLQKWPRLADDFVSILAGGLGDALAGVQSINDVLVDVGDSLKKLLSDLIAAVAKTAIMAGLVSVLFPGYAAAAGGFGGLFKAAIGGQLGIGSLKRAQAMPIHVSLNVEPSVSMGELSFQLKNYGVRHGI